MAEGEGFEPPLPVKVKRFSRPPVSTAHTSLRARKPLDCHYCTSLASYAALHKCCVSYIPSSVSRQAPCVVAVIFDIPAYAAWVADTRIR